MARPWVFAVAWLIVTPLTVVGQQQVETAFERDVNRYRWSANALVEQTLGRWRLSATNRFTSDAFILFNDGLSFRDENLLNWRVQGPSRGPVSARFRGRSLWYTQSRVFSQEILSGIRYDVQPDLWVEPAVGVAWDRRPGIGPGDVAPLRTDYGPAFGTRLAWFPTTFGEYRISVQADGAWQVINPRRGRAVRLDGSVARNFDQARLSTDVRYSNFRRDAYQAVSFLNRTDPGARLSETVEATASDTLDVAVRFDAPIRSGFVLTSRLDVGANNRLIRTLRAPEEALFFDTAFNRRAVEGELGIAYESRGSMIHVSARAGAEDENRRLTNREDLPPTQAAQKANLLRQADYTQGLFALTATGRAGFGRFAFNFDGSSSILRHDTPDANLDDRDELYHNGQAGALVRINRYVQANLRVLGTYYHTVYLNAARSAENNIQRSLRLRPELEWSPSAATRIRLSSEIRATYTVHDFVLPGRRATDQSARELRYDARLEQSLGGRTTLFADGAFSDLRLGRLLWDDFAEIPFDTLRTYSGWVRFQVRMAGGVTADAGLRFYIRSDFDRATTIRYPRLDEAGVVVRNEDGEPVLSSITRPGRSWIEQIGPTCSISWPMAGLSTLRIDGWFNVQHVRRRLYGDLPEASADRIRRAGREGSRLIIPNVAMVATWRI